MTYSPGKNLCFLDSLVHFVALALPEIKFSELSRIEQADGPRTEVLRGSRPVAVVFPDIFDLADTSQLVQAQGPKIEALREFRRVVELIRKGGETVDITQLGRVMSEACDGVQFGEQGDASECLFLMISWWDKFVSMKFCETLTTNESTCDLCDFVSGGSEPNLVHILGVGCLKGKNFTVAQLLREELQEQVQGHVDFGCGNHECLRFKRREEIKEILSKDGGKKNVERLKGELEGFTGTRKITSTGTPDVLLVGLNRSTPGGRKSVRQVDLEVGSSHNINDGTYKVTSVMRHYGSSSNSGHWTTLVVSGEGTGTWHEYQLQKKVEVPTGQVSSKDAVYVVLRRVKEGSGCGA